MSEIIETKNLCCKSGKRYLIHNINWSVKKGEHWIIFGMNGSGKTTLLSIIAGFNAYTSGECSVFGEKHTDENIFAHRRKIGWVSSSFFDKYLSWESALDIVLSGVSGTLSRTFDVNNDDIKLAKKLLSDLRLKERINQPFCLLSKGERQCVLIARALISKPEILILDEPGTGLDIYAREYILRTVEDLAENTVMTMIYVTHYAEEILPSFDKTLLLKDGKVYAQGKTDELFTEEIISDFLAHEVTVRRSNDNIDVELTLESGLDIAVLRREEER